MTQTEQQAAPTQIIESVQQAEQSALEAVRRFVDTVDGAFPKLTTNDEGPRRQIIDSAFTMVQNLVGTSNQLAENVLQVTARALQQGSEEEAGK